MFDVTNICCDKSSDFFCRDKFCRSKHTFVVTKDVLCHDKRVFVTTTDVCHEKTFVILVAAPADDKQRLDCCVKV